MVNEEIRKFIAEVSEDAVVFDDPSFDDSIIALTTDGRVVYDYEKMAEEMSEEDGISIEDAYEFIDYNTLRALSYENFRRDSAPVVIDSYTVGEIEDIRSNYGNKN